MASYGNAQWEFLLNSNEVTAFVAVNDDEKNSPNDGITNSKSNSNSNNNSNSDDLLGCLLRVDMGHTSTAASSASSAAAAGFGMMLVSSEARGQGVAKKLLHEAMSVQETMSVHENDHTKRRHDTETEAVLDARTEKDKQQQQQHRGSRKLLAVCTALGQPVYSKLGFAEAGRVTALHTTLAKARAVSSSMDGLDDSAHTIIQTYGSLDRSNSDSDSSTPSDIDDIIASCDARATGSPLAKARVLAMDATTPTANAEQPHDGLENARSCCSSSITPSANVASIVASLDERATGWNRRGRIETLVRPSESSSLRSVTVLATNTDGGHPIGAAVLRQEGPESPLVVGPILGPKSLAPFLVASLARAVPQDVVSGDTILSLLLVNNNNNNQLVETLVASGFWLGFDLPAMAMDGEPIYRDGDGSYLGLIHPTLG